MLHYLGGGGAHCIRYTALYCHSEMSLHFIGWFSEAGLHE